MVGNNEADRYSEEEAQRRFEATLKGALSTPPSSQKQLTGSGRVRDKKGGEPAEAGRRPRSTKP